MTPKEVLIRYLRKRAMANPLKPVFKGKGGLTATFSHKSPKISIPSNPVATRSAKIGNPIKG